MDNGFSSRRLTSVGGLGRLEVEAIFERADRYFRINRSADKKSDDLRGRTLINLFFEPSTRTQLSFELAGKRLGADVANFSVSSSSISKGESFADTLATVEAMRPDLLVIRHPAPGAADFAADQSAAIIVNAGDGAREHPTQALLDAFALRRRFGALDGLRVAICGDVLHSRVARSNVALLNMLNVEVRLVGPPTLLPADADRWGAEVFHDLDEALEGCDAVMMLRLQRERMTGAYIPSPREYHALYGMTAERLSRAKPGAAVLHPGPMNRGVEIDADVADLAETSLIQEQVEAGVAVRMAVLALMNAASGNGEALS